MEIDNQIQPLLDEKTELELMAQEIENTIRTLNSDKGAIVNETKSESQS